jgi:hypothetical protein
MQSRLAGRSDFAKANGLVLEVGANALFRVSDRVTGFGHQSVGAMKPSSLIGRGASGLRVLARVGPCEWIGSWLPIEPHHAHRRRGAPVEAYLPGVADQLNTERDPGSCRCSQCRRRGGGSVVQRLQAMIRPLNDDHHVRLHSPEAVLDFPSVEEELRTLNKP